MRARALIHGALAIACAASLGAAGACDGDPTPGGAADASADASPADASPACPSDLPASCPAAPPSYQAEVRAIIERRCFPCHASGGTAARKRDFSTYDLVAAQRSPFLNQLYACAMPPEGAPAPTPEERKKLLEWLVCKAPNN